MGTEAGGSPKRTDNKIVESTSCSRVSDLVLYNACAFVDEPTGPERLGDLLTARSQQWRSGFEPSRDPEFVMLRSEKCLYQRPSVHCQDSLFEGCELA